MPDNQDNANPESGPARFVSRTPPDPIFQSSPAGEESILALEPEEEKDPEGMPQGEPNVRLSKKRENEALSTGLLNIGMHSGMLIPTKKTQLAGFYVEDPSLLINQFPQYKWVKQKDGTRGQ
jgi:hypothetical protein